MLFIACSMSLSNCSNSTNDSSEIDETSFHLGVISAFSEVVNAGVKPLALSHPLSKEEMALFLPEATKIAAKYDVQLYLEKDLITTKLFPADVADGKEVLLLYQGHTLDRYLAIKRDKSDLTHHGIYNEQEALDVAVRFGKLLGYSSKGIQKLIQENR
ncbi:MAG: hypothetical protein AB8G86_27405 [Saprospiraceae bacterium]